VGATRPTSRAATREVMETLQRECGRRFPKCRSKSWECQVIQRIGSPWRSS
jgi:hypothetical protein